MELTNKKKKAEKKYKFTKKCLCIIFDFFGNPNQTQKQLAARYQTHPTRVSKVLTEFFKMRESQRKAPEIEK